MSGISKIDRKHFEGWIIGCFPAGTRGVPSAEMAGYIINYLTKVLGWEDDFTFEPTTNRIVSPPNIADPDGFKEICAMFGFASEVK